MNVALVAMLGLGVGQPAPPASSAATDYHPFTTPSIKLPIALQPDKVKNIRQLELHVSNDGGQVWQRVAAAPPTQKYFEFKAPADGRYWFHIVSEDLKGQKDPANLVKEKPALKVLFDTKKPVVTITTAKWEGEFVTVTWKIDEQFPREDATRVYVQPVGIKDHWQAVTVPANSPDGVKFRPGIAGPIVVRVEATDLVGHKGEATTEVREQKHLVASASLSSPALATPAGGVIPPIDANIAVGGPVAPLPPPGNVTPASVPSVVVPPSIVPPSLPPPSMIPPSVPPPSVPPPGVAAPKPPALPTAPVVPPSKVEPVPPYVPPTVPTSPHTPIPTFDPRTTLAPSGATAPSGPVIEESRAEVINALRFDLNYQVEQRGPSGISRVDLWVTRDDGKSWVWWSQHDGREAAVKVNLNTTANAHP
jgi:hypothetical protein